MEGMHENQLTKPGGSVVELIPDTALQHVWVVNSLRHGNANLVNTAGTVRQCSRYLIHSILVQHLCTELVDGFGRKPPPPKSSQGE